MSFTKLLHGFSFDHPWFNCVASLHRSLTGLHPVDICFVNIFFPRSFGRLFILMPYFQNVSPGSEYSKSFFIFRVCSFKKIASPIDNLHVLVCNFSEYAVNLDHSIGHDSFNGSEQSVSNKKY